MNVIRLHKVLVYLLVSIPFGVLMLGGEMNLIVVGFFIAGSALSWFWQPPEAEHRRWGQMWTIGTIVAVVFTVVRLVQVGGFDIAPLVDLALMLTVFKLSQRRGPNDYVQLTVLSFLLMAAASAFNQDLIFGLAFVLYLILLTMTLAIKHLHEEWAEHHPAELAQFRVQGSFLLTIVGLALLVFAISAGVFALFPRVGFNLFDTSGRSGLLTSGFSDEVSLGAHGSVREDDTIVMRVRFPGRESNWRPADLRWRGISFDRYDGVRWRQTIQSPPHSWLNSDGLYSSGAFSVGQASEALVQDIYLEPLDTDILFGLPIPHSISFPEEDPNLPRSFWRESVRLEPSGEVYLSRTGQTGVHYLVYSELPPQPAPNAFYDAPAVADFRQARLRTLPAGGVRRGTNSGELHHYYLQLPTTLTDRFHGLAQAIVAQATTPFERARALEEYLSQRYDYTLDLPVVDSDNPIESFLFDTRRGHCEYFATAMTLLARSVGLPARNVNGFYGGDWNPIGKFVAVRQSNAHSWVEIYLPEVGWTTFEPTPSVGIPQPRAASFWAWFGEFFDSMRMIWYRHIVDYDLESQLNAAQSVASFFGAERGELDIREMALSLLRNLSPMLMLFTLWVFGVTTYGRRHRSGLPFGSLDWLIGLCWVGAAYAVITLLWRPEAGSVLVGAAVAVPVFTTAMARRWRRATVRGASTKRAAQHAASRLYLKMVRLLVKSGYHYGGNDTPGWLLRQAEARNAAYIEVLRDIVHNYHQCRFGLGDDGRGAILEPSLAALKTSLRELKLRLAQSRQADAG